MTKAAAKKDTGQEITVFALDDDVGVLDRRELISHIESWSNGRWYEPPINPRSLAALFEAAPHHASAIRMKRNLVMRHFIPHELLSADEFGRFVLDYLVMGNAFLESVPNYAGRPAMLRNSLAINTRRGLEPGQFFFLQNGFKEHEFEPGRVFHLLEHDVAQEIYGRPEYLSAMQSMLLNESATLFRRRYYLNGAHAGFVFYLNEASVSNVDTDAIRESLRKARGRGNFRNLFLHAPGGKKDGVQIIPISEVAAKDEFLGIKNVTRDDMLAAHRVPPQLIGVIPTNNGGFGDAGTALEIFLLNEIGPLMTRMEQINHWLAREVVRWKPFQSSVSPPA